MIELTHQKTVLKSFIQYPFRLYFLLCALCVLPFACFWAMTALGLWPDTAEPPLLLHAYGFLNIVGSAAFAGFLFTALPEWTHDTRDMTPYAMISCVFWLLSLLSLCFSMKLSAWILVFFWFFLCLFCIMLVWKARDDRQITLVFLMGLLCAIHLAFALEPSIFWLKQEAYVMSALIAFIAFRIGKAIGQKALEKTAFADCVFMPNPFYRNLSIWLILAFLASNILEYPDAVSAWLSIAAGLALLGRLRDWLYSCLLRQSMVRYYCIMLFCMGMGFIWQGVGLFDFSLGSVSGFHLLMIGGYLGMILQVLTIAGTVHSSLPLSYPLSSRWGLLGIFAAAFARAIGPYMNDYVFWVFYLPAGLLVAAFGLYLPVFTKVFVKNPPLAVTARDRF